MTENIRALKDYQWDRAHHAVRRPLPEGIEAAYRQADMPDVTRTAVRLETALAAEIPFIAPGEIIAIMDEKLIVRTVDGSLLIEEYECDAALTPGMVLTGETL